MHPFFLLQVKLPPNKAFHDPEEKCKGFYDLAT